MVPPGAPPPDPTNAKADDPAAAALGKELFSDASLSPSGKISCASCHAPDKELADGLAQSTGGVAPLERNAPAIALSAHARWQFWDGRADALWVQALGPMENDHEFGSTRLYVAHAAATKYRAEYEAVWGLMPDLADTARFPAAGKPGSSDWATMAASDQKAVTRVFVNLGKSIAAFERTFRVKENALDRYVAGDTTALSDPEKDGLVAFFASGCVQCHYGPRLTDDAFHVVRFPTGKKDGLPDRGRVDGIALLNAAEISAASEWSDHVLERTDPLVPAATLTGAFKTPALRGIPGSAPYGHGGTLATFDDVIANHASAGLPPESTLASGTVEPWLPPIEDAQRKAMPIFLQALTAEPVIP
jgi:cytochrome c peroxidase